MNTLVRQQVNEILMRAALPDRALRQPAPAPQGADRWDWGVTALWAAAIALCAVWVMGLVVAARWVWEQS